MAVWAAGARVIYIRDLGLEWLCAAVGHAVDTSVVRGKWVFFFPGFCLWIGYGGVWQNLGSVVIGVLTGPWAAESWCLSMCISS